MTERVLSLRRPGDHWTREPRILIVDDQPSNVSMLETILRTAGVTAVATTTDPTVAPALFESFEPDLVLLDLHMPGMNGFEVLERLVELTPPDAFVPVVVLTADDDPANMERALASGAKDFLLKPFDFAEVVLRIRNLLQTRALHLRLHDEKVALEEGMRRRAEEEARLAAAQLRASERIHRVLSGSDLVMVFQPISHLGTGRIEGVEALARFTAEPRRAPNLWFAEAAEMGLGTQLELAAVSLAIGLADLAPPGAYLAVNVSPSTVTSAALMAVLRSAPPVRRLVVEITEHAEVQDYGSLCAALDNLRANGWRIAVDDAGAGFASLRHILRVRPEIIKLDITLTRGLHRDPVRRALASSLVTFAAEMDATITAEGVESREDRDVLRDLGVAYGQGFFFARPAPLPLPYPESGPEAS